MFSGIHIFLVFHIFFFALLFLLYLFIHFHFSCGYGKFGQCGVGDTKTQQKLVKLNIEAVCMIECGDGHCIAVDKGTILFNPLPFLLPSLPSPLSSPFPSPCLYIKHKDIKSNTTSHIEGGVYAWGSNRFGQCGVLPFGNYLSPTLVEPLCGKKVLSLFPLFPLFSLFLRHLRSSPAFPLYFRSWLAHTHPLWSLYDHRYIFSLFSYVIFSHLPLVPYLNFSLFFPKRSSKALACFVLQ